MGIIEGRVAELTPNSKILPAQQSVTRDLEGVFAAVDPSRGLATLSLDIAYHLMSPVAIAK